MQVADRISWDVCPSCGDEAALGWIGHAVVEFDCVQGCSVAVEDLPLFESDLWVAAVP
jgi:hypothetical protein